ncbi:uncharacterized protein LOC110008099 [Amborella trichopoda]|uniref:uncharacterized protein LOC110008099 n=1 Tax=Amborella trichopoda TaxID=13333 RepID=UPI0009C10FCB|nr:uncharacterized protein LOC110008099 [Amborella trichopoda]|eukprot:XP_020529197.1 uncharacterized protein LOC110008099 [Amborella trichopoda]
MDSNKQLMLGFEDFCNAIMSAGFRQSHHDPALFVSDTSTGRACLLLYVDDMIIFGDDKCTIHKIKQNFNQIFEMKDLGFLCYFFGLEIAYSQRNYLLYQHKYASEIVFQARLMDDIKRLDTSIELNIKLYATDGELLSDSTFYHQLVEKLIYLTIYRPYIAYVMHLVSHV